MGELAAILKEFLPQADIRFKEETGGRAIFGNFMIDSRRLVEEFGMQLKPLRQRVKEVINDIRQGEGLPPVVWRGAPSRPFAVGKRLPGSRAIAL